MSSLIVFAKEPALGEAKTRLRGCFSERRRCDLYKAFLKDTLNIAGKVVCQERIIAYSAKAEPRYLKKIGRGFKFIKQKGRNLGARISNVFEFSSGRAVIIGTDSPNLPVGFVNRAFCELDNHDVVLGPSQDGGYYLIGLNYPCSALFKGIEWSSSKVLSTTLKNAASLKMRVFLLHEWYDIDTSPDLQRLKADLQKERNGRVCKWTKKFLRL